ncbi:AAA family ATPase [Bradyrhizobium sp. SZCCHNS3053]|uniref:AAA family ATPase n=1 Tax=Bradyrhizobium sp. SZCCHNS3053 TaxID=3057322 RepID=UPI002916BC65|nr:AAA family ATPase [Bradyrhizobium sp. SZCCHNS3053]
MLDRSVDEAFRRVGIGAPEREEPPLHTSYPDSADGERIYDEGIQTLADAGPEIFPPLTAEEWRKRNLPPPDFVLGSVLTTTTRMLLSAATGLGKSMFAMAIAQHMAAGLPFLHWRAHRPVKVLYIDGEMARRLLKERIFAEEQRHSGSLENLFVLSREDVESFAPLNTPTGQAWLTKLIEHFGIEFVVFDNIMSLTLGDQKDPLVWQQVLPFAMALTRKCVGQIWIHHTGHDTSKGYGDKSREWQMDTVGHLEAVEREDTTVSFILKLPKARERTPATRAEFQDVKIALVNDRWEGSLEGRHAEPLPIAPGIQKALDALLNVLAGDDVTMLPGNRRAVNRDQWTAECNARGLIDLEGKANSARTLMNRFRKELVDANRIACEGDMQWLR